MLKLILASLAASVHAADTWESGKVFVATDKNYESFLKENSYALMKFYAPWCGHCKSMVPAYEGAAKKLGEEGSKIAIAKCDATVETAFPGKHDVGGYPTLKWFVEGASSEYDGPRDADGIVDWVKKMSGPVVVDGAASEDAAFSITYSGKEASEAFNAVAKKSRKAGAWHFVESADEKIVFQHQGEPAVEVKADASAEDLEQAVKANRFPLYGMLDGNTYGDYIEAGAGMVWTLLKMEKDTAKEVADAEREKMTAVAKAVDPAKFKVTWTNTIEFGSVLENMFGITEFPRVVVQLKGGDKKKFIYDGAMEADKITEFVKKVESGEIEADLKSQAVPEAEKAGEVRTVVGKNMKEMLSKPKRDVLFEIYAPWCGHCKRLEPEMNKVQEKLNALGLEDKMILAKMDGTENDPALDGFDYSGFPTLYFVKKDAEKPSEYSGGRDYDGMLKFLEENATEGAALKEKRAAAGEDKKADDDDEDDLDDDKEEL